jgi:hypothetical protein
MNNVKVKKSIYKKSRRRSRYDKLSSDIVASALSLWKKDFINGKKTLSQYFDQIEDFLEFDVYCDIAFTEEIDGFQILDSTGSDGRDFDDDDDSMTPFIQINFAINPTWLPDYWDEIYYYLCDVVRHEMEHITQDGISIGNYKVGKPIEDDSALRLLINSGMLGRAEYLILPKEVDANIQGLRFESRKRKESMINTINRYLDTQGLSQDERENVLEVWRQRAKKIGGIPLF